MDDALLDGLWTLNKDLPLWNVVLESDLENLHQVLELRSIFPISTPNHNHHQLLESVEPMSRIDDPSHCFLQMDVMPGMGLLDNADGRLIFSWKDSFESLLIQLWNSIAKDSKFFLGLL